MLKLLHLQQRLEPRFEIKTLNKEVKLSFLHEIEDARRVFKKPILNLSTTGLCFEVSASEMDSYQQGDYLRVHSTKGPEQLGVICYIEKYKDNYRIGLKVS